VSDFVQFEQREPQRSTAGIGLEKVENQYWKKFNISWLDSFHAFELNPAFAPLRSGIAWGDSRGRTRVGKDL
jgi:hypothetical protein